MQGSLPALTLPADLPALAMGAAASAAEGVPYNPVEVGYAATKLDDIDADGFGITALVRDPSKLPCLRRLQRPANDESSVLGSNAEVDVDQWPAGLGYNHAIAANTDLVARAAYDKFEVDDVTIDGVRFDGDDGYSAEVGVRSALLRTSKAVRWPATKTSVTMPTMSTAASARS